MAIAELVLQYLKALFNWPLVVLILGFTFKDVFADFFRRLIKGKGYGIEIEASTPTAQRKEAKESIHQSLPQADDEMERYIQTNPKAVKVEFIKVFNSYWFERAYNLIYGSQIKLLEYLAQKGAAGEKYENLLRFYSEFLEKSRSGTQMADFIGFLIDMRFVEHLRNGDEITTKITPYGVDFLSYIKTQYSLVYKFRVF